MPLRPLGHGPAVPLLLGAAAFSVVWGGRLLVSAGPLHDEAITMLAANAAEGRYAALREVAARPFGDVVAASEWHQFTTSRGRVPFARIRDDLRRHDIHPPLAFWLYNQWLAAWPAGGYRSAVCLTGILVLLTGLVLHVCLRRVTADDAASLTGALLFYLSNATVITSLYVRQYALLNLVVALSLLGAIVLLHTASSRPPLVVATAMGPLCLLGMLTQYLYAVTTGPLHSVLVVTLWRRRDWRALGVLILSYAAAATGFFIAMPGALPSLAATIRTRAQGEVPGVEAVAGLGTLLLPLPGSSPLLLRLAVGLLTLVLAGSVAAASLRECWRTSRPAAAHTVVPALFAAALVQMSLVAWAAVPSWATGPYYTGALVMLFALALSTVLRPLPRRCGLAARWLVCSMLLASQAAYVAHRVSTRNRTQSAHAVNQRPDLVVIDGVERGEVLPLTMQIPGQQPCLVARPEVLVTRLEGDAVGAATRVVWLGLPSGNRRGEAPAVRGWDVQRLPTQHPGLYDSFLLTR